MHEVIKHGVIFDEKKNWKGRGDDSYVFAAPISINGEDYICEVILMKNKARTGFYLHEVQVKEKLLDVFKTGVVTSTPGAPKSILLQVMGRVQDIERKCSKILDENGEPLVMYHGSPTSGIREFEIHKALYGEGAFFTSSPEEALSYTGLDEDEFEDWDEFDAAATDSGLMYEVFLNIRDKERFYERNGGALHARAVAANEIKSTTDNRGTFDGSNADIPFSLTIGKDRICHTQK